MAQRHPFFALLLVISACGGRESMDPPGAGGGGGSVATGTGGSSGTANVTGSGGASTAGQSGTGGYGQAGNDFGACTSMDTCVLEAVGVCGPGCEPVPLASFIAINSSQVDAYTKSLPRMPCAAGVCLAPLASVAISQNYYALCEAGHCKPVDVRMSALSACTIDDDCFLRSGTTYCGCGNGNLIAVSKQANVEQVFCGPGRACAADCTSAPLPPDLRAVCSAGHCSVHYPAPEAGTH